MEAMKWDQASKFNAFLSHDLDSGAKPGEHLEHLNAADLVENR